MTIFFQNHYTTFVSSTRLPAWNWRCISIQLAQTRKWNIIILRIKKSWSHNCISAKKGTSEGWDSWNWRTKQQENIAWEKIFLLVDITSYRAICWLTFCKNMEKKLTMWERERGIQSSFFIITCNSSKSGISMSTRELVMQIQALIKLQKLKKHEICSQKL